MVNAKISKNNREDVMRFMSLVLILFTIASVQAQDIDVERTLAKKLYKAFEKNVAPVCEDTHCTLNVSETACFEIMGIYQCTLANFEQDDSFELIQVTGKKAKKLYTTLSDISTSLCNDQFLEFCVNMISEVNCLKSGSRFNRKYCCSIKVPEEI